MNAEQINLIVATLVQQQLQGYNEDAHTKIHQIADDFEAELLEGRLGQPIPQTEEEIKQQYLAWFDEKMSDPTYIVDYEDDSDDNYWDSVRAGLNPETGEELDE